MKFREREREPSSIYRPQTAFNSSEYEIFFILFKGIANNYRTFDLLKPRSGSWSGNLGVAFIDTVLLCQCLIRLLSKLKW